MNFCLSAVTALYQLWKEDFSFPLSPFFSLSQTGKLSYSQMSVCEQCTMYIEHTWKTGVWYLVVLIYLVVLNFLSQIEKVLFSQMSVCAFFVSKRNIACRSYHILVDVLDHTEWCWKTHCFFFLTNILKSWSPGTNNWKVAWVFSGQVSELARWYLSYIIVAFLSY